MTDWKESLPTITIVSFQTIISLKNRGIIFLSMCKNINLQLPFIFMTGSPSLDFAVDFLKQGGAEYITKPFNLNDFVAKVNRVITTFQERENQQQFYASLRQKLDRRVREVTVYRDIYKSSADGYFIADLKREIIHVNAAFSAICGWQRKHLPMQMSEIFRFADGAEGNLEKCFFCTYRKG
jgi:response regulator RpfG family c-di-GMP phosphodiesterase